MRYTYPCPQCCRGTAAHEECCNMIRRAERDPMFVLQFARAAIEDAIYCEDGLDGASGEAIIKMIDEAVAATKPGDDKP